ncbi:MAG: carbohydrate kinase family protein [Actinomycetes bacterium]|nr:carbohydrate kinase family protein [Acidimicrobiia bacterium]
MTTIACLGDIDIDLLVDVDRFPARGEESFAENALIRLGGSAVNTAVVLARLGLRPTMLAQVGDDEFGSRALAELAAAGVGTEWVARTPADITGMNVVVIDPDGERTMIGLRGANRSFGGTWAHQGEWLHVSAYALLEGDQRKAALAILEQARREGVPISMDVPSGVARALGPQLVPAFDGVTVLTVGRRSLDPIGRDAAALAARCEVVAVTDGDRSVEIRRAGDVFRLTPPSVPVEDTTGAGDSFIAGLVASHSWGLDTPVAAVLAAALGAAAVQVPGAGRSLAGSPAAEVLAATDRWPDAEPAWLEAARRYVP